MCTCVHIDARMQTQRTSVILGIRNEMFHTSCSAGAFLGDASRTEELPRLLDKLNLVAQEALCSCVVVGKSNRELYKMDMVPRVPGTNREWFDW